jgi:type 1 fimbria pilin
MMHRFNSTSRCARLFAWLLLAIAAIGWTPLAAAAPSCTSSSVTLSIPTSVTIPTNAAVGSTLATGTATMTFTCSGLSSSNNPATIQAGQYLATLDPTNNTAGPGITFATGVSGLAVLVTATPVQATSMACLACGPTSTAGYVPGSVSGNSAGTGSGTVTANYTAALIKTGPIAPGNIASINLIPFWWYIPAGPGNTGTSMSLNANLVLPAISLTAPSCSLTTGSQNITVTLPGVATKSLSAAGQVSGSTAFSIAVTGCPTSVSTITTYFYSGATIDTTTGNLLNSNGTAKNVEVQLLNGGGGSAAAGSAINLAGAQASAQNSSQYNVTGGSANMNYFAQYIATGATTAGTVSTSVTFTIAYP